MQRFSVTTIHSLDQEGVGQLVEIGVKGGRSTKPNLKIGIACYCGILIPLNSFTDRLNYVSCSPFRIPVARLAAAAVLNKRRKIEISVSSNLTIHNNPNLRCRFGLFFW